MKKVVIALVSIGVLWAGSALAFQCPKLVAKINNEAQKRFDNASYEAKMKGAEATKLHAAGKHAEAEKVAKEGLQKLGM